MLLRVLRSKSRVMLDGVKTHLIKCSMSRTLSTQERDTLFLRAHRFRSRTAIIDQSGLHSYEKILQLSYVLGERLIEQFSGDEGTIFNTKDLREKRVAFLCPSDVSYVISQWAVWRNGGIVVPLCHSHPETLWEYVLTDCQADVVIATAQYASTLQNLAKKHGMQFMLIDENMTRTSERQQRDGALELTELEKSDISWDERSAMIVYTSGTTGPPKGVLSTHGNIWAQITAMTEAWEWSENDVILHVLPLHHVHGIVNVLCCPLYVGATCCMHTKFDAAMVWKALQTHDPQLSLFMAVPTIYAKLIQHYDNCNHSDTVKEEIKQQCQKLRMMVSGSAALPEPIMKKWEQITGQVLLERYGMTEFAMALTNPVSGPRIPGSVGKPFPGIEVRIMAKDEEHGNEMVVVEGNERETSVTPGVENKEGELQVHGPAVFKRYWNKPKATEEAFTKDGWFRTGDTAVFADGVYRIMGRTSVDIIKSGGYKTSALSIERHLLSHEDILDCAVLGVPDPMWGERVAAIVTCRPGKTLFLDTLRQWASSVMAPYEIPSRLTTVESIPKNTMGKVNKKELLKYFFND